MDFHNIVAGFSISGQPTSLRLTEGFGRSAVTKPAWPAGAGENGGHE